MSLNLLRLQKIEMKKMERGWSYHLVLRARLGGKVCGEVYKRDDEAESIQMSNYLIALLSIIFSLLIITSSDLYTFIVCIDR